MKKEVLRINNLNLDYGQAKRLEQVSLCILEGECVGFRGLTYSGKDLLVRLLSGDTEEDIRDYIVYIDGRKVTGNTELRKKVYRITSSNYVIDDWTVAEYIGLVNAGWLKIIWGRRALEEETAAYFDELELPFDVSCKMRELSELEKRLADLVKACRHGKKIVIIEDEFEGMRPESIQKFARVMRRLVQGRMAVIVNSHSDMVSSILSDKYIIFKKGRIVKKCRKDYIKSSMHLEKFLMGDTAISNKRSLDSYVLEENAQKDSVYKVRKLKLRNGRKEEFNFVKGEVTTFLILNGKEKERIFMLLSGRTDEEGSYCILNSKRYDSVRFTEFVEEKVVSVMHLGSQEEVFSSMSVEENLLLPSLQKISSLEYIASAKKMLRMLGNNMDSSEILSNIPAEELGVNDLISLTLERWYVYNPRVLVLFEPFALCDVYGVSIVKSYIKKFANKGTAVIILKSREEYVEDISDRIISLDE